MLFEHKYTECDVTQEYLDREQALRAVAREVNLIVGRASSPPLKGLLINVDLRAIEN